MPVEQTLTASRTDESRAPFRVDSGQLRSLKTPRFSSQIRACEYLDFCTNCSGDGRPALASCKMPLMNNRDNFSEKVRRAVAARAGWHCSFTGCGKLTVGPSDEGTGAVASIGEAAHICAASPAGRRYDALMTPDDRSGVDNAVWMCSDHAKLIDRDEVTYTAAALHAMKRDHEVLCARAVRNGSSGDLATGLLAVGPDVVCTGDLTHIDAASWRLRLGHFLIGDLHRIIAFIDGFARDAPENRYVLSNELGDGRVLTSAPSLTRDADGYSLLCQIAPGAPRVDAHRIGSGFATNPETGRSRTRVSGVDYLPQRVREVLSMQRGESPFSPTFGMRFFEYFEAFRGSPWLDLLFKLDVVRQASIPFRDNLSGQTHTPLQCVTRVRSVEVLADAPTKNRLPVRVDLEVQGLGPWTRELSVYVPTADQMAGRAKMRAGMPWLAEALKGSPR